MTASQPAEEWVWLARIRRPQGRKGEVFAEILTDFPEKFAERKQLWLFAEPPTHAAVRTSAAPPRAMELIAHWQHKGGIVLHFSGVDSISAAETLAGQIVAVPHTERAALAEDEVHIADLIGCNLVDVSADPPTTVGVVDNVDRTAGPVPLLIVRRAKGEALVPFAKSYLRNLDLQNHRIEMSLPEGLLDLNA